MQARPIRACTHIPNVALVDVSVFVWLSRSRISEQWSYGLCTLDLYVRARAHWPNVTQTDLNVVVVIIGVVVAKVVAVLRTYRRFLK